MSLTVIFIHGPAAAGKYTIGSELARLSGLPLFHNHLTVDLAKSLFDFGTPGFVDVRADIWRASFRAAAANQQSFIFTFHPESTVDPGLMQELDQIIRDGGGNVIYIELTCSLTALAQRMDNASRAQFGKLTDPELFLQLAADGSFDFPPLPQASLVIDTEVVSAGEAAGKIYQFYREEG